MAWHTPITWTTGQVVTSTDLNEQIRDNANDLDRRTTITGATVSTSQTTTSTSFTDLATTGPAATVTIGSTGKALVALYANCSNNTAAQFAAMGFAVSGATTVAASFAKATAHTSSGTTGGIRGSATFLVTSLNSGSNTFTAKYAVGGGTGTFADRQILVTPLGS